MAAPGRSNDLLILAGLMAALTYGTLFPFGGWQPLPTNLLDQFLTPGTVLGLGDILINIAIYVPLGLVLIRLLPSTTALPFALLIPVFCGALFSTSLELLQGYLPSRVSSVYDVGFNVAGTTIGTIIAMTSRGGSLFGRYARALNDQHRKHSGLATLRLSVIGLWLVAELAPFVPSLARGELERGLMPIAVLINAGVPFSSIAAIGYAGGIIAIAAILHGLLAGGTGRTGKITAVIGATLALKIVVVGRHLLPEAVLGAAIGFVLYRVAVRKFSNQFAIAGMIGIAIYLVSQRLVDTPTYFNWYPIEGQLVNGVIGIVDFAGRLWPYCGLAILAILARARRRLPMYLAGTAAVAGLSVALELLAPLPGERISEAASVVIALFGWSLSWLIVSGDTLLETAPDMKGVPVGERARQRYRLGKRDAAMIAGVIAVVFGVAGWLSVGNPIFAGQHFHVAEMHRVLEPFHRPPLRFYEFRHAHPRLPAPSAEDLDRLRVENPAYIERRRHKAKRGNGNIDDAVFSAIADPDSQNLDSIYRRLMSLNFTDRGHTQVEPLAMAYDWLYERWTNEQRVHLGERVLSGCEFLINLIRKHRLSPYNVYLYNRPLQALVACAIVTFDDSPRSEPVMQFTDELLNARVLPVWRQIMGRHGGWHEGGEYVGIGIGNAVYRIPAMWRHATGVDLFRTEPGLAGFLDFLNYRIRPDGTNIRWGDAGYFQRWSPDRTALAAEFNRNPRFENGDCPVQKLSPVAWPWSPLADSSICDRPIGARPLTKLFDGIGLVVARSDWNSDATYTTFKAGDNFWSHSHLDQGAFTIFKRHALAIDSGIYGPRYGSDHHMNYTYQSIAHNVVTVTDPSDTVPVKRKDTGRYVANDGGQRRIGSGWGVEAAPLDLSEWMDKRTIYHTATITHFEDNNNTTITTADLTAAYTNALSGTGTFSHRTRRIEAYFRTFVYDRKLDSVTVYDRIRVTDPRFEVRWLLHAQSEPTITREGFNVIVEGRDNHGAYVRSGLRGHVALPFERRIEKVGGAGFEFYVDGKNYDEGGKVFDVVQRRRNMEPGRWRIELRPSTDQYWTSFLVFMFPWAGSEPVDNNVDCVRESEQIVCKIRNLGQGATYKLRTDSNAVKITHG